MAAEDDEDVDSGWDEDRAASPSQGPSAAPLKAPARAKPLARRLGEGGEIAKLLADAELDEPKTAPPGAIPAKSATAEPLSAPPAKSRRFTPRVTNAVQQAKVLDTEAKQPPRRPTPMRVPSANAPVGSAPLPPELPPKLPTTSLRFTDKGADTFGDLGDVKVSNQRKQTLKLNRATQDLAVELLNEEADVYSARRRADLHATPFPPAGPEGSSGSSEGDRTSAPALDLHLGDFDDDTQPSPQTPGSAALKPSIAPHEKAPTTARSAVPRSAALPPPPSVAAKTTEADPLSSRLAPPRLPTTGGLRSSAGLRGPSKPREGQKVGSPQTPSQGSGAVPGISRLDTPSALSSSLPLRPVGGIPSADATLGGSPTKPPPPAQPTPVPPGFDDDAPVITFDTGPDVEVSVGESDDLDSLEIGEFEAASLAAASAPPALAPRASQAKGPVDASPKPAAHQALSPTPDGPPSAEPATVRGGPDDDPALAPIRERFERRDYMGALMRAEALLAQSPDHAGAKYFATMCQDRVKELYITRLGSGVSVPRLAMPPAEIQALSLDHRSGFLISLIDGLATVDDVLDISGMPMIEALRLLFELKNEGVIDT